ncbi:MAG: peptidylprolyl isomerase [Elusimicrobia bacterium]|nr:peptidylprolyl isomerase [Elusimicrobiota bacterium]
MVVSPLTAGLRRIQSALPACLAAAAVALAVPGCKKKAAAEQIRTGSAVKIHYTLTVDGAVVDSSSGKEPLAFVQGAGQIIPGLEEKLLGLSAGDKRSVVVTPEKGYGVRDSKAVQKVPKKALRDSEKIKIGDVLQGQQGDQPFRASVVEIGSQDVTLDFNHPLAGKTLNFDVEVMDVQLPL